ncbi:putative oligomerization/nucleic acid binding protein [Pedobacter cryoconitis]|uniref:Putative oligomerization/nucleic acid binding protein n=2 Tax=Pedobacter cryoconitis TaxID=188932 RepID=A0A327T7T5_9SPHI|nr:putative oligomerization/nucleic acid binding protein [Pedobacter cryoconitis]
MAWFLGAIIAAAIADNRQIGAGWAFFIALILSPVIGIIVALASSKNIDVELKNKLISTQDNFINRNNQTKLTTAEEIKQYKTLLDEGVITSQEFEVKKKQLLGIYRPPGGN